MKTAAIVVTYNRKELLKENIECLLAQKPVVPAVIVVDNHSTDGTKAYIQEYIDRGEIVYRDTGANLGGAGGFNYGMRWAVEDVERGWVKSGEETHRIPATLRQELLGYAKRNGILSGPLFRGNRETGMCRSRVTLALNSLAEPAQVDEKKCNPRCLRHLYQQTQEQFHEMAKTLVDQAQERMMENEQRVYGWTS